MQINNRIDIKNLILHIEKNYAVNDWKVNDIHIWPLLRVRLYLNIVYALENPQSVIANKPTIHNNTSSLYNRIINKYKRQKAKYKLNRWLNGLPQKEYLFIGFDSHRVDYKNARFNRFFDAYIINNSIQNEYAYLEKDPKSEKPYFAADNILFYSEYLAIYANLIDRNQLYDQAIINLTGYDALIVFLRKIEYAHIFCTRFDFAKNKNPLFNFCIELAFFKTVLQKIKPQTMYILCYYSENFMSLTAVANQMGVKTIEYQHGPQTDIHLAYSHWAAIPSKGYDMLPHVFWNWDLHSAQIINNWATSHTLYSSEVVGNFWVDYWKKQTLAMDDSDFILYTLQPLPVKLEQLFAQNLVSFIKNNDDKWYFRMHPRMFQDRDILQAEIIKHQIADKVILDKASDLPLPLLLANCKMHVTHFSGSTIEASQMGKFTVLLSDIGANNFKDSIIEGKSVFIDCNDERFVKLFKKVLC